MARHENSHYSSNSKGLHIQETPNNCRKGCRTSTGRATASPALERLPGATARRGSRVVFGRFFSIRAVKAEETVTLDEELDVVEEEVVAVR